MDSLFSSLDPTSLTDGLNPAQQEAVRHTEGPLLVVAGAGSGKTRVLTHRIAYLIRELGVAPGAILAITFTNKAAAEMKRRVERLVGAASRAMWVSTFHSACVRILRREIHRFGYRSSFSIYDGADSQRLISQCVAELDLDSKKFPPRAIRGAISAAKNELVDFETYATKAEGFYENKIAEVYKLYQQRLQEASAADFDDLLVLTVQLFQVFPEVLEEYQNRFQYLHVDEYQDTNQAQYELVTMLAAKHTNICVVGDEAQSIYAFRGADLRNIMNFEKDYPEAKVVVLDQNYRSTETILDAANAVIANNRSQRPKHLWTDLGVGSAIQVYKADDEHDEAEYIADRVRFLQTKGVNLRDMAVFYRTNAQSRVMESVFLRHSIPYKVVGGQKFYDRREIKDAVAYLRAVVNPDDQVALKRIINVPKRSIGMTSVAHIDRFADSNRITFFEALKRAGENSRLTSRAQRNIAEFLVVLEVVTEGATTGGPGPAMQAVLEATGMIAEIEADGTIEALGRVENLRELLVGVDEFLELRRNQPIDEVDWDDLNGIEQLNEYLATVSLVSELDALDDSGYFTLMTIHNAKGLEYPVVFLAGLEEGVFPHMRSLGEPDQLEEERRLAYVGITRAQDQLYLTLATKRSLWGGANYNSPSRFLKEIPRSLMEEHKVQRGSVKPLSRAPSGSKLDPGSVAKGDRVEHDTYGIGVIRELSGSGERTEALVRFESSGDRRLLLAWAPLRHA
jgi:DNA helicase-2/ATP-dependent DNA helicase PcrA